MVSVMKDGKVVKQSEVTINQNISFSLPAGQYDLRVEGERMQTLVKKGILVNEDDVTRVTGGPINAGAGVRIVEYATGGLSREEIAARIERLEAALAALEKAQKARQ